MRKISLIILSVLLFMPSVYGASRKNPAQAVSVTRIELARTGNKAILGFNFYAGGKATKSNYKLIVNPVLSNGENSLQLPSIVVQSNRSKINEKRHSLVSDNIEINDNSFQTSNRKSIKYNTEFIYEDWMQGANLYLDGISVGCCSATETEIGLIAERLFHDEPREPRNEPRVDITKPIVTNSMGDQLAKKHSFVVPVSEFEKARELSHSQGGQQNEIENFINETREGSVSIYFRQGRYDIDRSLGNNNANLTELVSSVRTLTASIDSKVSRIVIAGFASPEGSLSLNNKLALDRAVAVKNFLLQNVNINPEVIQIYNGSVDWTGLRELVAQSNMYQKNQIIDIINNVPVLDSYGNTGRHSALMRLDRGEPYRYMLREFFPRLRQAAYIKVYYENK